MKLTLTVKGLAKLSAALKQAGTVTRLAMAAHVGATALGIQKDAKGAAPVDTGRLRSGIQVASYHGGLSYEVFVNPEYGVYVEMGTGPAVGRPSFFPPSSALRNWAARHGMKGKEFLIARAISRRGQKPRPYFGPSVESRREKYSVEAARILRRELEGK